MTDFIVTITDPALLDGITWAREQHNAAVAPPNSPPEPLPDAEGVDDPEDGMETPSVEITPDQRLLESDEAYVQWVMEQAAISYAEQKEQAAWRQAYLESQQQVTRRRNG